MGSYLSTLKTGDWQITPEEEADLEAELAAMGAPKPAPVAAPSSDKMTPEQISAVYKFASERAKPMDDPRKAAMDEAVAQRGHDEGRAMLFGAGSDFADAIANRAPTGGLEKTMMTQAGRGVPELAKRQENEREEGLKRDELVRKFIADKLGLEDKQKDNARADESLKLQRENSKAAAEDRDLNRKRLELDAAVAHGDRVAARRLQYEIAKLAADAKADKKQKVSVGEAANIGQLDAGDEMIDALGKNWEELANKPGVPDALLQFIPGTDAAKYGDAKLAAAQSIGTILEEGKLTDSDLKDKYGPLMPSAGDSADRKKFKLDNLRHILRAKKAAKLKGLGDAGYDVSGFGRAAPVNGAHDISGGDTVTMQAPDGSTRRVPRARAAAAVAAGGKVL